MSDPRGGGNGNGNGNGNQLGGFSGGLGSAPLPPPGGDTDQIDVPGVGQIPKGQSAFHTEHAANKAVYDKLVSAGHMLDHIREEMDKLSAMGDTVTPEDVVAGAGRLVGHGVRASELAAILSEMPTQAGQGLAAWVAQNDALVTQQEQHVAQMRGIAAYRMGVSAVRVLAANHLQQRAQQRAATMGGLAPRARGAAAAPATAMAPSGAGGMPQPQIVEMMQGPQAQGGGGQGGMS